MFDHRYVRQDGTRIPVSELTDEELAELLACEGFQVVSCEGSNAGPVEFRERLKVEKVIRDLGLWLPPGS